MSYGYHWELHAGGKSNRTMVNARWLRIQELLSGYGHLSYEQKTQLVIDDSPWLIRELEKRIAAEQEIIRELEAHLAEERNQ